MKKLKILLFITIFILLNFNNLTNATINFSVTPIVYNIETETWSIIYKSAILRNNSNKTVAIKTWKTDFQANWTNWIPQFVRKSELVYPEQELSSWITIETDSFLISPNESKDINFTIQVPNDASPWWHYWAVCFKNNNSEISSWWNIGINIDYCTIILVNIDWEIITEANVESTKIKNLDWSWWGWWYSNITIDDCIIDLTPSNYDWLCINNFFSADEIWDDIENLDLDDNSEININDFNINFETLFINEWNTHLLPEWKITLIDEDWNQIKWIWKETIKNDEWAKIWVKIVDYLPINDEWWNVLPSQKRIFNIEWQGFPYEWYDKDWNMIIKYWTPDEYYTRKNIEENWFLFPWERVNEKINHEKVKAYIDISYINKDWEIVEFSSAQEFFVDYKEKYIWLNPYSFICSLMFFIILLLLWIIFRKKKGICINKKCKRKLEKDMKICPYCETIQDKKKLKRMKKIKNEIKVKKVKNNSKKNKIINKKKKNWKNK